MDPVEGSRSKDWLHDVLEDVGLQQFYPKLTNELQLTKLSHFDYVSEKDLMELGLSRPAAKRLLAAVKKRKSFVNALKNKIVGKLIPNQCSSKNGVSRQNHDSIPSHSLQFRGSSEQGCKSEFGRLTCLINSQDLLIKEEIGHGVHGFVKKGEWTTPNGRVVEVALKILRKDVMSEPGGSFNDFVKEISVMHQLDHPNIIKLFGVVLSSPMMMVTELAPFGNLRDKLRKENGCTPISHLINFGVQIASGMEYLESRRFVHRDLAARNIFVSHGKKILIGDLGLMRVIPSQEDHYVMSEKTKIPYPWCAPESLRQKLFSSASDVYMFGVTMWELFSFGKEPWAGLNMAEILVNVSSPNERLSCPQACPTMVYQTLLQCWNTEPAKRPNFSTLYQYLSTSYPLEVRSTQPISELNSKGLNAEVTSIDLRQTPDVYSDSFSNVEVRCILNCNVDDRILVIDGQPEKYWWKGQNQRTYSIGWFPLCSTRWLAPKKGANYISKPLKNSFIHTGHCGLDGRWGSPKFIDHIQLKNGPVAPGPRKLPIGDLDLMFPSRDVPSKPKSKSRISRLFGINENSFTNLGPSNPPGCYQKFNNETQPKNVTDQIFGLSMTRSRSDELAPPFNPPKIQDDAPPLINLDDDVTLPNSQSLIGPIRDEQQPSLIDMDNESSFGIHPVHRHLSDTKLNQLDGADNYDLSCAGSWNTGTFDGSCNNIYSAYYCAQDATSTNTVDPDANRYYSAVSHDEDSRQQNLNNVQ